MLPSWVPSRAFRLAPLLHSPSVNANDGFEIDVITRDVAREHKERGTQTEDLEHTFHFDVHGSDRGRSCQIKGVFVTVANSESSCGYYF
jgi:hypothetical protein